jgi:hypothetical protein
LLVRLLFGSLCLVTMSTPTCSPLTIEHLPDEVVLGICLILDAKHIGRLGATCRRMHCLTGDDTIWRPLFARDFERLYSDCRAGAGLPPGHECPDAWPAQARALYERVNPPCPIPPIDPSMPMPLARFASSCRGWRWLYRTHAIFCASKLCDVLTVRDPSERQVRYMATILFGGSGPDRPILECTEGVYDGGSCLWEVKHVADHSFYKWGSVLSFMARRVRHTMRSHHKRLSTGRAACSHRRAWESRDPLAVTGCTDWTGADMLTIRLASSGTLRADSGRGGRPHGASRRWYPNGVVKRKFPNGDVELMHHTNGRFDGTASSYYCHDSRFSWRSLRCRWTIEDTQAMRLLDVPPCIVPNEDDTSQDACTFWIRLLNGLSGHDETTRHCLIEARRSRQQHRGEIPMSEGSCT